MAATPQLPFDLILTILNERKEIKKQERLEREAKENYNNFVNAFNTGVKGYITQDLFWDEDSVVHNFGREIYNKFQECETYNDLIDLMDKEGCSIQECLDMNDDPDDHFNDNSLSYWVENTHESHLRFNQYGLS